MQADVARQFADLEVGVGVGALLLQGDVIGHAGDLIADRRAEHLLLEGFDVVEVTRVNDQKPGMPWVIEPRSSIQMTLL